MRTNLTQRESDSGESHKLASAGSTPASATISRTAEGKRKGQPIVVDQLGGIAFRPRINHAPAIINGPARADGKPWFSIVNKANEPAEIFIYDQIGKDWWSGEGIGAKDYIEALQKLDPTKTRDLDVHFNSPGGNVYDGLAITEFHQNWKGRVNTFNDGIAASIASVMLVGSPANGGKVHAAKASSTMIHRASTVAMGTVDDMQRAISALEAAEKNILAVYEKRTGKTSKELSDAMAKETWFTGPEAKDFGFVDEITDTAPIQNTFDLSNFRRVPEAFRKLNNSVAQGDGQSQKDHMDKAAIIALLKAHGVEVDANSTIEQLQAKLGEILAEAKKPKPAPAPAPAATDAAAIQLLKAQMDTYKAERDAERKQRITTAVNACVAERRIVAAQAAFWIEQATANEAVLAQLQAMPQNLPAEGVSNVVIEVGASIADLEKHALRLDRQTRNLAMRGEEKEAAKAIKARGRFILDNRKRIIEAWDSMPMPIYNEGTNTIDTDLKQDVLLMDALIEFKKQVFPITRFAKNIGATPLRGTTTIRVPFVPNDTVAATTWNAANGYVAGDTAIEEKSLALTRYYKAIRYTADELRRQPYLLANETFVKAADKLAYDVWTGFLAVITAANYDVTVTGYAASGVPTGWPKLAGAFDSNAVADLRNTANLSQWPMVGRSLIVNSDYDTALLKDNAVKNAMAFGSSSAVQDGTITKLLGFDYGVAVNLPTNSENLVGLIAEENAVLIGSSPIAPTESEMRAGLLYSVVSDPDLGLSLEYKNFGQPQMNREFRVIEANWAAGAGNKKNLYRLTSA